MSGMLKGFDWEVAGVSTSGSALTLCLVGFALTCASTDLCFHCKRCSTGLNVDQQLPVTSFPSPLER